MNSLGIMSHNRNCWLENRESELSKDILKKIIKEFPEPGRKTRTTTTITT